MNLSIAIAAESAAPSAFVVWRGFERAVYKAREFGYDGIELALKSADEFEEEGLAKILDKSGMRVSCISTGQVFAALGMCFTHPDAEVRRKTVETYRSLIRIAGNYGGIVNIGRARGYIPPGKSREETEKLFLDGLKSLLDDAERCKVDIIVEPVNRYEINFINTVDEAAKIAARAGSGRIGVMPDVFHMNIEDDDICKSLARNIDCIKYIHLADSNRYYPGRGHLDFRAIIGTLRKVGFEGWCSVEILPKPDPDTAALEAARYLLPLIHGK